MQSNKKEEEKKNIFPTGRTGFVFFRLHIIIGSGLGLSWVARHEYITGATLPLSVPSVNGIPSIILPVL